MTEEQEPTFLQRGATSFASTLREAANYKELKSTPYGLTPLMLLVALGFIQTFDGAIFGLAGPDVVRDLDISVQSLAIAASFAGFFLIFAGIGAAYMLDRIKRVPFVAIGAIINGLFSILTTRATGVGTLALTRTADSVGSTVGNVPVLSLLADYYPPESRGKVFALSGVLGNLGGLVAPAAVGYLIVAKGWRFPFLITGPALILAGIGALFLLKEPVRGYMERRALGVSEEVALKAEEPPSLAEAWRTIWAIKTLRRLFVASIPTGAGLRIFSFFFAFLLVEEYGLDAFDRGRLSVLIGIFSLPGAFLGGGIVDSLIRRRPQRVLVFTGVLAVITSFVFPVFALVPPLWVVLAIAAIYGFVSALLGPAGAVVSIQVIPAHVRTLGLAVQGIASIPSLLLFTFLVVPNVDSWGFRGAIFAAFPFILVGALIQLSAAGLFEKDMRAALASQLASEEFRRSKEAGKQKLLVCRDIDVEYDGVQVLFGVDFDVEEGDIVALLGTNGAGKSTLLKAISGTQEASNGAVLFDGRDTTHMPPSEIMVRGVTHMPGGRGIFPGLSVRENLMLGTWITESNQVEARINEVYEIFPVLRERGNERAELLSGGEQQMLSLSQAFLSKPRLLMIDELSLGLSPAVVQQLIEIVKRMHQSGTTIILVEQSVNVALTVAERAIFMEKGEVKFVGKTADLLTRPDILRAVYVKGTGALTSSAPTALKSERERRGYQLSEARNVLEVKGISKNFGGIVVLDDVTMHLRDGEILGLIGPNGAGKTTLFDIISGYQAPDGGQILYDGVDITSVGPEDRAAAGIIRRFQNARLFPSLTVYENLLLALDRKLDARSTILIAMQVPAARQSERKIRRRADALIDVLHLGDYRDKFVKELSTGLRRMADLACVLATEPKVLMLDEPSTGIAQAEAESLGPLLRRVRFETSCSVLIIEHDMALISSISDELVAMDQGKILTRGSPEEVLNNETVIQSYLGTSEEVIQRSGVVK